MKKIFSMLLCLVLVVSVVPGGFCADGVLISAAPDDGVSGAIGKVIQWYKGYEAPFSAWDVIVLESVGNVDQRSNNDYLKKWVEVANEISSAEQNYKLYMPLLPLLAAGQNPDYYVAAEGEDIISLLGNSQGENGSFGDYIGDSFFAIVALEKSRPSAYNTENAKKYLLSQQCPDGGYNYYSGAAEGDVDMTGMALLALACYRGDERVEAAIDKAVAFLYGKLNDNNGYTSPWNDAENICSLATAISGLTAVDETENEKYAAMCERLLTYQETDGGFPSDASSTGSDWYGSYQALLALGDMLRGYSWTEELSWENTVDQINSLYKDKDNISDDMAGYVAAANQYGFMTGYEDGQFAPQILLKRSELAAILVKFMGIEAKVSGSYLDVASGAWYAAAITTAAENKWILPDRNMLDPNGVVTCGDVAVAISAIENQDKSSVDVEELMKQYIEAGIFTSEAKPSDEISRESAARIFVVAYNG